MFPEPTELLLIGCLTESIWTPRTKSNTSTPKSNSQTFWQREISHVMNGSIFCVCSTSAISVPPIVLKWCRKERKKMQMKEASQQNQSRWWIWSCDTAQGIQTCLPRLHQKARGKPDLKVKYLWARGLSSNQERGDLWWAPAHQTIQNVSLTKRGLLKSGNLMKCWKQERWDPWVGNRSPSTQTSLSSMTMIWTPAPPQHQTFRWSHGHSCTGWMIDCERYWTIRQQMQYKTSTNVLWFGECWCLQHWKHLYSLERITQNIYIPSKIQEKVSQWNRCLTYLKSW